LPKEDWTFDGDLRNRFDAKAAWQNDRYKKPFWFVLDAKDYGMHKPRDAEMLRIGIDKLKAFFVDGLELAAKAEPFDFGNLPAQKLPFRGEVKSVKWLGECQLFFNNGIAYWLIVASPDEEVLEYFVGELPAKHVFVMTERRGWREQPLPTESFASSDNKLDMTALKGIWESGDPKDEDPNCNLLLTGKYLQVKDRVRTRICLS